MRLFPAKFANQYAPSRPRAIPVGSCPLAAAFVNVAGPGGVSRPTFSGDVTGAENAIWPFGPASTCCMPATVGNACAAPPVVT